jgi:hypothetical protein
MNISIKCNINKEFAKEEKTCKTSQKNNEKKYKMTSEKTYIITHKQ